MALSVRAIFDTLKWVKGEWHAHSWNGDNRVEMTADSYDTDGEGLTCNGVCAMGAIHVALGRTNRWNDVYGVLATYEPDWLANNGQAMRLKYFREMLREVGDLIAGKLFGQWALTQEKPHTLQYGEYSQNETSEGTGDIIAWNDHDNTTEDEVMDFFDTLDGYPPFRNIGVLIAMSDDDLYEVFDEYWATWPNMTLQSTQTQLDSLVAMRAI